MNTYLSVVGLGLVQRRFRGIAWHVHSRLPPAAPVMTARLVERRLCGKSWHIHGLSLLCSFQLNGRSTATAWSPAVPWLQEVRLPPVDRQHPAQVPVLRLREHSTKRLAVRQAAVSARPVAWANSFSTANRGKRGSMRPSA
jgi:hypothetical protein